MPPPLPPPKYAHTAAHREPKITDHTFNVTRVSEVAGGYKFEGVLGRDVSKLTRITITRSSDQEDISVLMHDGAGAMQRNNAQGKVHVVKKEHFHGKPHLHVEVKITQSDVENIINGDKLQIYFTQIATEQDAENALPVQFDNFIAWYIDQLQSIITKLHRKHTTHTQAQMLLRLR